MKVAYKHLISCIPSKPSIDEISERFFQLGHEHEIEDEIFFIFIFGFGLITFFEILSQYIFSLDKP